MGWFSADEVIAPVVSSAVTETPNHHTSAQTIALCVLAAVAVGYVLLRTIAKIHRQQTERVAARTVQLANLPPV